MLTDDPGLRENAEKYVPYSDMEIDYVLFELSIEFAFGRIYGKEGGFLQKWKGD